MGRSRNAREEQSGSALPLRHVPGQPSARTAAERSNCAEFFGCGVGTVLAKAPAHADGHRKGSGHLSGRGGGFRLSGRRRRQAEGAHTREGEASRRAEGAGGQSVLRHCRAGGEGRPRVQGWRVRARGRRGQGQGTKAPGGRLGHQGHDPRGDQRGGLPAEGVGRPRLRRRGHRVGEAIAARLRAGEDPVREQRDNQGRLRWCGRQARRRHRPRGGGSREPHPGRHRPRRLHAARSVRRGGDPTPHRGGDAGLARHAGVHHRRHADGEGDLRRARHLARPPAHRRKKSPRTRGSRRSSRARAAASRW